MANTPAAMILLDKLVYFLLLVTVVVIVLDGPVRELVDDDTKFVEAWTDDEDTEYPTVSLCKFHGFKCGRAKGQKVRRKSLLFYQYVLLVLALY